MTAPARGRLNVPAIMRGDVKSVLHRQQGNFFVWTVNNVSRVKFEFPGKTFGFSQSFLRGPQYDGAGSDDEQDERENESQVV